MKKSIITLGLLLACFANQSNAATTTTDFRSSVNQLIIAGNSPLCRAISKGDIETVKKFVEYGADVNESYNGMTPLMVAARHNNVELLEYLLSKGAVIHKKNDQGLTALKYAEASNAREAVAFLKERQKK
ncbi:MAG: ankyrin repeat domain-containing protein [Flavobacterium sp.]|nr:ankyrin repeat domain-containing protein [Flavobacterium sp.]